MSRGFFHGQVRKTIKFFLDKGWRKKNLQKANA